MRWIKDLFSPGARAWEDYYRSRWQHDKRVRSAQDGSSWDVFVKGGVVTWQTPSRDYPLLSGELPAYEPRGSQQGAASSWYQYGPTRVKHAYVRGALLDMWRRARKKHDDPVDAWGSIQDDDKLRRRYQRARGKGGLRRAKLTEAIEICAAANMWTAKRWGPDRIAGYCPTPASAQLSCAAGARLLSLLGGTVLSHHDWAGGRTPAPSMVWGEAGDVSEAADWYNAKMIALVGADLSASQAADAHFLTEARHNGTKVVALSPQLSTSTQQADQWVALRSGSHGAFWLAVCHVILSEHYASDKPTESFADYARQLTDGPMLVELEPGPEGSHLAGRQLRAGDLARYQDGDGNDAKLVVFDAKSGEPRAPGGSAGHRWGGKDGQWNLKLNEEGNGSEIDPLLTLLGKHSQTPAIAFHELDAEQEGVVSLRQVPAVEITKADGSKVLVTTVFDLLMARFGVARGLEGDYPADYDDAKSYTPAWQQQWTGVAPKTVIAFAREWADTARRTDGKCKVIFGDASTRGYHDDLAARSAITALMLCGSIGKSGGGMHDGGSGQRLTPRAPWSTIAFAQDWLPASRQQNATTWHYVHSGQWRYEEEAGEYQPTADDSWSQTHAIDLLSRAVRLGWQPLFPQFDKNSLEVVKTARAAGADSDETVVAHVVQQLKEGELSFAVQDPDAPACWPRMFYVWGGDALSAGVTGHEYFLRHYLGTHDHAVAEERAEGSVGQVSWRQAPHGKLDLLVTLASTLDTTGLYADVILPAATWCEKEDLASSDSHAFLLALSEAAKPAWEARSEWDLFRAIADQTQALAKRHFPEVVEDLVCTPIRHGSDGQIANGGSSDWLDSDQDAVPGTNMPNLTVVRRDYHRIADCFRALGSGARTLYAAGVELNVTGAYDELLAKGPTHDVGEEEYPSLAEAEHGVDAVLALAPESCGEVAHDGYRYLEKLSGLELCADLSEGQRGQRLVLADLQAQPRRMLNSPSWSGLVAGGRPYSAYSMQVERLLPWRTLSGRQHFYLDHPLLRSAGEGLPAAKQAPLPQNFGDLRGSPDDGIILGYVTPQSKWSEMSGPAANIHLATLARGGEPIWLSPQDADKIGVRDGDWVEAFNDNGVVVAQATVSHRVPAGSCLHHRSSHRGLAVPKSPLAGDRRAGVQSSLTRIRLKPTHLCGGYGQLSYQFDGWGPVTADRDTHVRVRRCDNPEL